MAADRRRLSVVPAVATAPGRPLSGSASAVATTPLFPVWWASNDCYLEQGIARSVLPLCVGFNAERPLTGTTAERLLMAVQSRPSDGGERQLSATLLTSTPKVLSSRNIDWPAPVARVPRTTGTPPDKSPDPSPLRQRDCLLLVTAAQTGVVPKPRCQAPTAAAAPQSTTSRCRYPTGSRSAGSANTHRWYWLAVSTSRDSAG